MLEVRQVVQAGETDRSAALALAPVDDAVRAAWMRDATRVSLPGLLDDLDRRASAVRLCPTRASTAFRWDDEDVRTPSWVPQGLTTSADADASGLVGGRDVLLASWYLRGRCEPDLASRVSVVDLGDPARPAYRHVLLVEPAPDPCSGAPRTLPVPVHAGGLAWYGDLLYVAATFTGLRVFDLADLVRADPADHGGFEFLLPQRAAYRPAVGESQLMRYSFVSVDRTSRPHALLAGEYGRGEVPTQVVRYPLDERTGWLRGDAAGVDPSEAFRLDVVSMQGAACLDGTYFVSSSRGRHGRGHLWVGDPGRGFRRHRWVLPPGPEDLCADAVRGRVWSLTEWPGRRSVFALRAQDWAGP